MPSIYFKALFTGLCCLCGFTTYCQKQKLRNPTELNPDSLRTIRLKDDRRRENQFFMEQTLQYAPLGFAAPPFCDLGSPKHGYILSADIIPEFVIGGRWMPFPIHFTPRYKVRIFRNNPEAGDSSLPVRTPSFMPGATVFFPVNIFRGFKRSVKIGQDNIAYTSLSFFHHSNGQDGPEFDSQTGGINLYNGNFSTNYLEPAIHWRWRRNLRREQMKYNCASLRGYRDYLLRIGAEFHMGTADALKSSYGKTRINASAGMIWVNNARDNVDHVDLGRACYLKETARLVVNATLITGARDMGAGSLDKRINADISFYYRIPRSPNTAGFIALGWYGSDTYNIYYLQSYAYIRLGLALGLFVYQRNNGNSLL